MILPLFFHHMAALLGEGDGNFGEKWRGGRRHKGERKKEEEK